MVLGILVLFLFSILSMNVLATSHENASLSPEETRYNQLKEEFSDYEDDFRKYKREYFKARLDKDTRDSEKYEDKLERLETRLQDLQDDIEELLEDLEDDTQKRDLFRRAELLEERAEELEEDISDVTSLGRKPNMIEEEEALVEPMVRNRENIVEEKTVIIRDLNFPGYVTSAVGEANQRGEKKYSWMPLAWLVGGIVVALVLIVFLLATLVREIKRK